MRDQLERRLAELKSEFETGQARLRDLNQQQALLQETLLRISGAIQVLEELMNEPSSEGNSQVTAADVTRGASATVPAPGS